MAYGDLAAGLHGLGVHRGVLGVLGPPRDRLLHPVARIPWMRRQFLARLAGAKTGVLGALDPSDYSA